MRALSLLFLLITSLCTTSCKKDDASPDATAAKLLVGRWALVQSSGGIAGGTYPADPSRKQEIVFTTSQAVFLLNGTVTRTSSYTLSQASSYITGKTETFIIYDAANASTRSRIEQVSAATLSLSDDSPDGFGTTYIRN